MTQIMRMECADLQGARGIHVRKNQYCEQPTCVDDQNYPVPFHRLRVAITFSISAEGADAVVGLS